MSVEVIAQFGVFITAAAAAYLAVKRAPNEKRKVLAEAELARVDTQARIIDDLQEELDRYREKLASLEARFEKELKRQQEAHEAEKVRLEGELETLRKLNIQLQKRVAHLEGQV